MDTVQATLNLCPVNDYVMPMIETLKQELRHFFADIANGRLNCLALGLQADDAEEAAEGGPDAKREDGQESETQDGKPKSSDETNDCQEKGEGECEYEFTQWEERVLEVVMDAMRMSALALALQAVSSILLGKELALDSLDSYVNAHHSSLRIARTNGVAVGINSSLWDARTYFMNDLVDQSVRAFLLFSAAGCFRRIPETEGKDITHLLEGLGKDHGLGQLFRRMQKLAWGMATFKGLGLVLPYIMATSLWQRAQAFVAFLISKFIPYGGKLVSYAGL